MGLRQGKALALTLETLSLGRSQLVGHWDKAALFFPWCETLGGFTISAGCTFHMSACILKVWCLGIVMF